MEARKRKQALVTRDRVVNDIIRLYPKTISVFTEFKIDSCCGGAVSIKAAAKRDKVPIEELMRALNEKAAQ